MIARLQQWTTCSLALAAFAWTVLFWKVGHPGWALAGGIAIVFGYSLFLAVEFMLLALINHRTPQWQASASWLMRAWFGEVLAAPRAFCWRQPFRSTAEPDTTPSGRQRGVILVHGLFCNRGFWNPWISRLRVTGTPVVAVNLEPAFGSIDDYITVIDGAVQRMQLATDLPPILVGHSMGGLALRAWFALPGSAQRAHHLVTIGTPHHGTWMARFAQTRSGREMRIGSAWLATLCQHEPTGIHARFTCFFSRCDNIVFPTATATLPGADNREVEASAHVQMAFQPEVFDEVMRRLSA